MKKIQKIVVFIATITFVLTQALHATNTCAQTIIESNVIHNANIQKSFAKKIGILAYNNPIHSLELGYRALKIAHPNLLEKKPQKRTSQIKNFIVCGLSIYATSHLSRILGIHCSKNDSWKKHIAKNIALNIGQTVACTIIQKAVNTVADSSFAAKTRDVFLKSLNKASRFLPRWPWTFGTSKQTNAGDKKSGWKHIG